MTKDFRIWTLESRICSCEEVIKKMTEYCDKIRTKNEQFCKLLEQSGKECYKKDLEENEELLGVFGESIDLIMLYKKVIVDKLKELSPEKNETETTSNEYFTTRTIGEPIDRIYTGTFDEIPPPLANYIDEEAPRREYEVARRDWFGL